MAYMYMYMCIVCICRCVCVSVCVSVLYVYVYVYVYIYIYTHTYIPIHERHSFCPAVNECGSITSSEGRYCLPSWSPTVDDKTLALP